MTSTTGLDLPDYVPVPRRQLGATTAGGSRETCSGSPTAPNQSAFLATDQGIVLFDAPPTIGHNLQRAIDEVAEWSGQ
jgi:hypothetical protein